MPLKAPGTTCRMGALLTLPAMASAPPPPPTHGLWGGSFGLLAKPFLVAAPKAVTLTQRSAVCAEFTAPRRDEILDPIALQKLVLTTPVEI